MDWGHFKELLWFWFGARHFSTSVLWWKNVYVHFDIWEKYFFFHFFKGSPYEFAHFSNLDLPVENLKNETNHRGTLGNFRNCFYSKYQNLHIFPNDGEKCLAPKTMPYIVAL